MNNVLVSVKVAYDDMGRAEKRIADWITENHQRMFSMSITELASECSCGEATIVRFARRLGLDGYQGLKIALAMEEGQKRISGSITGDDTPFEVFEKVIEDIYCSLEMTKKVLKSDQLALAAQAILSAKKVVLFGLGNSASIALDAQHKLMRAGINAVAYSDNHMQSISASHLCDGDVAIGISHSGSSRDIVEALQIAREKGATTISITNKGRSPITKQSDIVLNTASDETQYSILALNSRISQLALIDSLYYYIAYSLDEEGRKAIDDTEQALMSKKF